MQIRKTPGEIFAEYEEAVAYKAGIGLYDTVKQNENFFIGRQWEGVNAPDLDKPVFNILKRVVSFFLASLVSDDVTAKVSAFGDAEATRPLLEAVNNQFTEIAEHTDLKAKNRQVIRNAAVDGDGCLHFWFAPGEERAGREGAPALGGKKAFLAFDERQSGLEESFAPSTAPGAAAGADLLSSAETAALLQDLPQELFALQGNIEAEVLENTDVCFGNPQLQEVQSQPYILGVDAGSVTARGQMAAGYDRFLSVHFNAGGGAGTEIYTNCAAEEGGMEQALEAALTPFVGSRGILSRRYLDSAFVKRGISENGRLLPAVWGLDWYGVLRGCHSVGVGGNLLEMAFIDHAANLAGYLQHKEEIWDALASAVCQGLGVTEPAQPSVPAAPAEPSPSAGGNLYRVFLAENPVQIGAFKDLENDWRFAHWAEGREGKSALVKRVQLP